MTRNAFITQLEKRLADMFPSWEAKEQELTLLDIQTVMESLKGVSVKAIVHIIEALPTYNDEVKA